MSAQRNVLAASIAATLICVSAYTHTAQAQADAPTIEQCAIPLQKDLYSYAYTANLKEDYIRTIDRDIWQEMKSSGSFNFKLFDMIELGNSYDDFNARRDKLFDQTKFTRDFATSTNIIRMVTATRAYASYDKCLDTLREERLTVVPQSEDTSRVVLKIRYNPPLGADDEVDLKVTVEGGDVLGDDTFELRTPKVLLVNVARRPGTATTRIQVSTSKYSVPQFWKSTRNDGWLQLAYAGTVAGKVAIQDITHQTWNNDERRKGCKLVVGHTDAGVCISYNLKELIAPEYHYYANARDARCVGGNGCGWIGSLNVRTEDQGKKLVLSAVNWGPPADLVAVADLMRQYGENATPCGDTSRIPVVYGQAVVISGAAACRKIMTVTYQANGAGQDVATFTGDGVGLMSVGALVATDGQVQRSFTLRAPETRISARLTDAAKAWWDN